MISTNDLKSIPTWLEGHIHLVWVGKPIVDTSSKLELIYERSPFHSETGLVLMPKLNAIGVVLFLSSTEIDAW